MLKRRPRIRSGRKGDGPAAARLFYEAVHRGTGDRYSDRERHAWAPCPDRPEPEWEARLLSGLCLVADHGRGRLAGFMTLGHDGHLDFAYVAPDHAGTGLSDTLYTRLETEARQRGLNILTTEASHLARSFLHRHGWTTEARQSVIRNGVALTNFRMQKML